MHLIHRQIKRVIVRTPRILKESEGDEVERRGKAKDLGRDPKRRRSVGNIEKELVREANVDREGSQWRSCLLFIIIIIIIIDLTSVLHMLFGNEEPKKMVIINPLGSNLLLSVWSWGGLP
jgi:hypothetical protein